MKVVSALALAGLMLLAAADRGAARIHSQMYCWELDSEFPVPCEGDDEDDELARGGFRALGAPALGAPALGALSLKPDPWRPGRG
jgi:hypothetical protein